MTLKNRKNHSATDESVATRPTIALVALELVRLCSHGGRIGLAKTNDNQRT